MLGGFGPRGIDPVGFRRGDERVYLDHIRELLRE